MQVGMFSQVWYYKKVTSRYCDMCTVPNKNPHDSTVFSNLLAEQG